MMLYDLLEYRFHQVRDMYILLGMKRTVESNEPQANPLLNLGNFRHLNLYLMKENLSNTPSILQRSGQVSEKQKADVPCVESRFVNSDRAFYP